MPAITLQEVRDDPGRDDIFGLLNKYIQPESTITASEAAATFTQSIGVGVKEEFFWSLWKDVFNVARQIPHNDPAQDKLALFVRELTLVPETGEEVWDARVWTDLPLLGSAIRDNIDPPIAAEDKDYAATTKALVSFHAFVARLLHAGVSPASEITAIWMLRAALEEPEQEVSEDGSSPGSLSRFLMLAAVYIEYAGATLVQKIAVQQKQSGSQQQQLNEMEKRMTRGGYLWNIQNAETGESSGLTAERWKFWGKKFREQAASKIGPSDEAKELALHAGRLIEVWSRTRLSA